MQNSLRQVARSLFVAAGLSAALMGCQKSSDPSPAPTLYDQLGGVNGVSAVVDQFLSNVVAETSTPNSKLKRTFQPLLNDVAAGNTARLTLLRDNLIDQIGQAAGGPLVYKGKTMQAAHKGMSISNDEFSTLVAQLSSAMATKGVPAAQQTAVVAILAPMQGQIVGQ